MSVTLSKKDTKDIIQAKIYKIHEAIQNKRRKEKTKILRDTAGKILFEKEKSSLDIQREMRNDRY